MKKLSTIMLSFLLAGNLIGQVIPIATIQGDPSYIGQEVTIEGVITIGAGRLTTDYLKAFIQDSSGKGIQIWDNDLLASYQDIKRGNKLAMTGTIVEYNGNLEITDFTYVVVEIGLPIDDYIVDLSLLQANNCVEYEGTFIETVGYVEYIGNQGVTGYVIYLRDDDNNILKIYINYSSEIPYEIWQLNDEVAIRGATYFYNNECWVGMGYPEDVLLLSGQNQNFDEMNHGIHVYPNPFSSKTIIAFPNPSKKDYTLTIYQSSGKDIVRIPRISSDKVEIEKGNMTRGVYIVEVKGEKLFRGKMVVK